MNLAGKSQIGEKIQIIVALIAAGGAIIAATIPAPLPWDAKIVIIIVTLLVTIIINKILLNKLERAVTPESKKRIILPVIISCILIFASGGLLNYWYFTQPAIIIKYPMDGREVDIREDISGQARNIPNNNFVWIFVYSYPDNVYYPHSSEAQISNSSFTSPNVIIGAPQDVGQKFNIIACLVDEKGLKVIQEYLGNPSRSGLPLLPPRKVCNLITVTRRS